MDEELRHGAGLKDGSDRGLSPLHEPEAAIASAPEDVAALYSRAPMAGAKYRDFSASRQMARARSGRRAEAPAEASGRRATRMPRPFPAPVKRSSPGVEASRWAALKNVLTRPEAERERLPLEVVESGVPAVALLSIAGGVGKTSMAASLSRLLAGMGERVLLADTQGYALLPLLFRGEAAAGMKAAPRPAEEVRGGVTLWQAGREFHEVLELHEDQGTQRSEEDAAALRRRPGAEQIAQAAEGMDRIVIDVASGSAERMREAMRLQPVVLVVLTPDMASVVSLDAMTEFFDEVSMEGARPVQAYYVLNRFDPGLRLHLDIQEALRMQLGDRLLPFALRHSRAMSEAMAEGMTVETYAAGSEIAEDMKRLARWLQEQQAAPVVELPGMRWRER